MGYVAGLIIPKGLVTGAVVGGFGEAGLDAGIASMNGESPTVSDYGMSALQHIGINLTFGGLGRLLPKISKPFGNYKLTDEQFIEHIVKRHGPESIYPWRSKFSKGIDIRSYIHDVLTDANSRSLANTGGRPGRIIIKSYPYTIGFNAKGKPLNAIKVVLDEYGNVITAYPVGGINE